jgi:hypothetical protein
MEFAKQQILMTKKLPRPFWQRREGRHYTDCFNSTTSIEKLPRHHLCVVHWVRKTATITGKKTFQFQPVTRTPRSYKRVGLIKRQKSFPGLTMYGHEVLMSLQTRAKLFGTHFLHCFVNDIRLWRITVYSTRKRWQHSEATSFMSDFDDVNSPVTVANCIFLFGSQLNCIGLIQQQNDTSKVHCDYPHTAVHCKPYQQ